MDETALWILQTQTDEDEEAEEDVTRLAALLAIMQSGADEAGQRRDERRRNTRQYLTRPDLLPDPRKSATAWQRLYKSRSDRAFITTMGFDVASFHSLLDSGFARRWDEMPIPRPDTSSQGAPRPHRRSLDAAGGLGLVLHYLNSTMSEVTLQGLFALIPATASRYITFGLLILHQCLKKMPKAAVLWPRGLQFEEFSILIQQRHDRLVGAFGSIDGLNLPVQTSSDQEIENATYNGWLSEHFVSSVLVFAPDRTIIAARLNAPGSWHDSRVAEHIYEKLLEETPEGYYLVADSAFPRGAKHIAGRIKAPIKAGQKLTGTREEIQERLAFDRQLLSYRQTAEWGMRALQGSFGRLRIPLDINHGAERAQLLETCVRLHNFRTRTLGVNQIRTVYFKHWWDGGDEDRLFLTFEHLLFSEQRRNDRVARFHIDVCYDDPKDD